MNNIVLINGRGVSPERASPYSLLNMMREENAMADAFRALKLPSSETAKLLQIASNAGRGHASETPRLDIRNPNIFLMNNIEKDREYSQWSPRVQELLQPVWPGQMRYVRKNLFTGVLFLDPLAETTLETSADLFLATFRRMPTANAEGQIESEGR